jgi:hypothetical protein
MSTFQCPLNKRFLISHNYVIWPYIRTAAVYRTLSCLGDILGSSLGPQVCYMAGVVAFSMFYANPCTHTPCTHSICGSTVLCWTLAAFSVS